MPNYLKDPGYLGYLGELEQINGIPAGLLPKILKVESGGNPKARSPVGARGIAQFMPATAKEVGIDPDDPIEAAGGAAIYLRRLHNQFGDWEKAVMAYNAGPGNISKGIVPKETQNYVSKVFGKEAPTPAPKAAPKAEPATPGALSGPTLPPYLQDLAEGVVKYLGVQPEGVSLEDIKRLPKVAGSALLRGLGTAADFFLGGPIITSQQTAPAFGLSPLPEIPKDFVTESLTARGLISPTSEPRTPRERRVAAASELVGTALIDPTLARAGVKGVEKAGRHLLEEVGTGKAMRAGQRGMFGTEKSVGANIDSLERAKQLESKGISRDEIWRWTRWARDPGDKEWRFEIPDEGAGLTLSPRQKKGMGTSTAGELLSHPWLFKHEPYLKDTPVEWSFGVGPQGNYYADTGRITIQGRNQQELKSALLHELQHAVQVKHGLAEGGNVAGISDAVAESQRFIQKAQTLMAQEPNAPKLDELMEQVTTGKIDGPTFEREYERVVNSFKHANEIKRLNEAAAAVMKSPYEAYRRLAGEAEARNVQKRMEWTPEKRRAIPPWRYPESLDVPESELIVRRGEGPMAAGRQPPRAPAEVTPEVRAARATAQGYLPQTLYHGTVHSPEEAVGIEAFDPTRLGKRTDTGWYGRGIYMTAEPGIASEHAQIGGGTVYPLRARLKKPLTYTRVGGGGEQADAMRASNQAALRRQLAPLQGWTPEERAAINAGAIKSLDGIVSRVGPERFTEVLKANGYDGVIVNLADPSIKMNRPMHEVVAFEPNQIRSVHADFEPAALKKPILGATSAFSKQRGAIGPLGRTPPPAGPPPTPTAQRAELAASIAERKQVLRDIRRLSDRESLLSQSEKDRLGQLHNELRALNVSIRDLQGTGVPTRAPLSEIAALNSAANVREIARRGRQTWAMTEQKAIALRAERLPEFARTVGAPVKEVDSLMRRNIGEAYNAEHIEDAAHQVRTQWADDQAYYRELVAKMEGGTFSDTDMVAAHERMLDTTARTEQYFGVRAEAGRALQIFRKTQATTDLAHLVHEVLSKNQNRNPFRLGRPKELLKAKIRALAALDPADTPTGVQTTRKLLNANSWPMFYEYLYSSMLSGFPTHVANSVSNLGVQLFEDIVRTGTALVPGSNVTLREAAANLAAWPAALVDGFRAFGKVARTEQPWGLYDIESASHAIPGKLGKVIRLPLRALQAEDAFFKALTYRKERDALAIRESLKTGKPREIYLDKTTPEGAAIDKQALLEAERRTFTNPGGTIIKGFEKARSAHPMGRLIVPFVRTPGNVLKMGLQNSVLGVAFKDIRQKIVAGGAERDLTLARMAAGSGLAWLGFTWAANGDIVGGAPLDPVQRDLFYESGRKPYSRRIGNEYVPFNRADPFAMYMGAMADAYTIIKAAPLTADNERDWGDFVTAVVGGITQNFSDKTFMQSISNFVEAYHDPGNKGEAYIANVIGMAIPKFISNIAKAEDPFMREAHGILDRLRLRIPGERQELPRKVSGFGEFVPETGTPTQKYFSPFIPSEFRDDPLIEELLRLGIGPGVQPRYKEKTILQRGPDGVLRPTPVRVDLDPKTYELLATTRGRLLRQIMSAVVTGPGYQRMPDYDKKYLMKKLLNQLERKVGAALGKGLEAQLLRLAMEQHPIDIMDLKVPGRPPAAP